VVIYSVMTHKLRIIVLRHLGHGAHSGYQLIKEIKEQTGWKPSYGSIYPLLEQLRREGLVTAKEEGKRKLYTLTAKGKTALHLFTEHHDAMIQQVREWQKVMAHLCDADHDPFFEHISAALERGEIPFKEILKSGYQLRAELARLSEEGLLKKHKDEVMAVIDDATRRLKAIGRSERIKRKRRTA
jgi:DNA-binding PadR family transcriptional regulator